MIIILPCAGGCAANFRRYIDNKDFCAYEYSGHWTRYEEPLIEHANDLVEALYWDIIDAKYEDGIELFGHSMGGLLAWLLADKLIQSGFHVKHLYIAACCEPQIKPDFLQRIKNDVDIKNTLRKLRQIPEQVLDSDFFNENLLPPVRNDFSIVKSIIEATQGRKLEALPIDITCLYGVDDPVVKKVDMLGWNKLTSGKFNFVEFKGDHFFLYEKNNSSRIISLIIHCVSLS